MATITTSPEPVCQKCDDIAYKGNPMMAIVDSYGHHQPLHRECAIAMRDSPDNNRMRRAMINYLKFAECI